jgi:hypothetical protein
MAAQENIVVSTPVQPEEFLDRARQGPNGRTFTFGSEFANVDPASLKPHMQYLMGVYAQGDERFVRIGGKKDGHPVPTGVDCFSFHRGVAYIQDKQLLMVKPLEKPKGIVSGWETKCVFKHDFPIHDAHLAITGDLFIVDSEENIIKVAARNPSTRRFRGLMKKGYKMHPGTKIPKHPWQEAKTFGENIYTRNGLDFFKNGKLLCKYPAPPKTLWDDDWNWFVILWDNEELVVVSRRETVIEKDTGQGKTATHFRAAHDARLLFENPGDTWRYCQAGLGKGFGHIVAYDVSAGQIKVVGGNTILLDMLFTEVRPHFVGVMVISKGRVVVVPITSDKT